MSVRINHVAAWVAAIVYFAGCTFARLEKARGINAH
jgi:hypothetical protein